MNYISLTKKKAGMFCIPTFFCNFVSDKEYKYE